MENKYNLLITPNDMEKTISRLTNQLWKLIPMKENKEDWKKQGNTVLLEIVGLYSFFQRPTLILQLIFKLEGLLEKDDIDFFLYRKTVFESINILQEFKK